MAEILTSQVVSGLATGCVYALIALGFVLIFKATDVVNCAQGEFVMASGFISFTLVIGSSLLIMLALYLFFKLTKTGTAMRATAQSQTAARLMGVSVKRIFSLTWAISAAVGGVAGVLIAPIIYLDPNLGFIGVKAFAGAILGGFGSIPGAIVGGMLLGILENLSGDFFNAGIKQVSTYILLILVLVVRPSGLFGAAPVRKV